MQKKQFLLAGTVSKTTTKQKSRQMSMLTLLNSHWSVRKMVNKCLDSIGWMLMRTSIKTQVTLDLFDIVLVVESWIKSVQPGMRLKIKYCLFVLYRPTHNLPPPPPPPPPPDSKNYIAFSGKKIFLLTFLAETSGIDLGFRFLSKTSSGVRRTCIVIFKKLC